MVETLKLNIPPRWEENESVRVRTAGFLRSHGVDADTSNAISMVASELTENANKYGSYSAPSAPQIEVEIALDPTSIVVEVRNPVGAANAANLERLDEMIQHIRGYQDPFEVYVERLREVSGQRLDSAESGLGLVRVAFEGQSILDFYVNDNDILAVSAIYQR